MNRIAGVVLFTGLATSMASRAEALPAERGGAASDAAATRGGSGTWRSEGGRTHRPPRFLQPEHYNPARAEKYLERLSKRIEGHLGVAADRAMRYQPFGVGTPEGVALKQFLGAVGRHDHVAGSKQRIEEVVAADAAGKPEPLQRFAADVQRQPEEVRELAASGQMQEAQKKAEAALEAARHQAVSGISPLPTAALGLTPRSSVHEIFAALRQNEQIPTSNAKTLEVVGLLRRGMAAAFQLRAGHKEPAPAPEAVRRLQAKLEAKRNELANLRRGQEAYQAEGARAAMDLIPERGIETANAEAVAYRPPLTREEKQDSFVKGSQLGARAIDMSEAHHNAAKLGLQIAVLAEEVKVLEVRLAEASSPPSN